MREAIRDSLTQEDAEAWERLFQVAPMVVSEQVSIREIVEYLEQSGIRGFINVLALEDEGFDVEERLPLPASALSVGNQLLTSFPDYGLTLRLENGLVVVSTLSDDEERMKSVTFDVTGLDADPIDLINAIQCTVDPLSWEDNGGPSGATTVAIVINGRRLITVRNRSQLLFRVRQYLQELSDLGRVPSAGAPTMRSQVVRPPASAAGLNSRRKPQLLGGGLFNLRSD